jgi:hypothetical protein
VLSVLRAALQAALPAVERHHVWLLRPPQGAPVNEGVWLVVSLAALAAMEAGRAALWAGGNGLVLSPAAVADLAQRVALEFWASLSDYAAWAPSASHEGLLSDHPFLRVSAGRLHVAPR